VEVFLTIPTTFWVGLRKDVSGGPGPSASKKGAGS
jgi:hypothetical protein